MIARAFCASCSCDRARERSCSKNNVLIPMFVEDCSKIGHLRRNSTNSNLYAEALAAISNFQFPLLDDVPAKCLCHAWTNTSRQNSSTPTSFMFPLNLIAPRGPLP